MVLVSSIGGNHINDFPSLDQIEEYFKNYNELEWASGGTSGGSLNIYGAEGTEKEEPFVDRVDIHLSITDSQNLGMFIYYSKTGGKYSDHFYSCGNKELINEFYEHEEGEYVSKALFISPLQALTVVSYFIQTLGGRSSSIDWYSNDSLPSRAMYCDYD